tara:strand:+ start:643 stop:963 length:321 start_codon:yes stop_codon:yes gene_type:complete
MKKITIAIASNYSQAQFWNGMFNMTAKELEILVLFLECADDYSNLCTLENKKLIAEKLKLKDKNTLNNYIKKLKDKRVFSVVKNCYVLHDLLNPSNGNIQISLSRK